MDVLSKIGGLLLVFYGSVFVWSMLSQHYLLAITFVMLSIIQLLLTSITLHESNEQKKWPIIFFLFNMACCLLAYYTGGIYSPFFFLVIAIPLLEGLVPSQGALHFLGATMFMWPLIIAICDILEIIPIEKLTSGPTHEIIFLATFGFATLLLLWVFDLMVQQEKIEVVELRKNALIREEKNREKNLSFLIIFFGIPPYNNLIRKFCKEGLEQATEENDLASHFLIHQDTLLHALHCMSTLIQMTRSIKKINDNRPFRMEECRAPLKTLTDMTLWKIHLPGINDSRAVFQGDPLIFATVILYHLAELLVRASYKEDEIIDIAYKSPSLYLKCSVPIEININAISHLVPIFEIFDAHVSLIKNGFSISFIHDNKIGATG